ncbi:hypothetical protein ILUMI_22026 [Ignelater luminosus]|uniref:Uncharacterized protein n=1 Tax=Ignelater luminosus TaxID=2038154 RepID=A0A8K0CHJ8_IGNLU|nr:hypothetical protein ILUMI_22026 [Ignelater luminosus]
MKLPKRELPKYTGDVRGLLAFCAAFQEIDKEKDISDAENYPISGKNYDKAVEDLTERFSDEKMLIQVYVRNLFKLVIENAKDTSKISFVDLVTSLISQIKNLAELGVRSNKCAQILYAVVESCFLEDILITWQRSLSFEEDLGNIVKFLKNEVNSKTEIYSQFCEKGRKLEETRNARAKDIIKGKKMFLQRLHLLFMDGIRKIMQVFVYFDVESAKVLLQTLVVLEGNNGYKIKARAMIDTGSQKSYVLHQMGEEEVIHHTFGG